MGLVSDGGVHSGWEHIEACIELAAREGVPDLVVHAFTDGRDTPPEAGAGYLAELERWLKHAGRIGTVSGRYYAMDRDRRWDRIKQAYDAIVHAEGRTSPTPRRPSAESYERDETDEFIAPDGHRRLRRDGGRRRRAPLQLPARTARGSWSARSASRTSTSSRAGSARGSS